MKIVNGKKFYAADYGAAKRIDNNGWDRYDGQNWKWYSLFYNPACGLVVLEACNSGSCRGDYLKALKHSVHGAMHIWGLIGLRFWARSTNRTIARLILWRICLQAARLCRKA